MNVTSLLVCIAAFGAGGPGTAVMPLLNVGQGPRAAALGESYLSIADDATAVYWNPAGLGQFADSRLAFSHHQWFAGITDELLHGAFAAGPGTLGVGMAYSRSPGIERWSREGEPGDTFCTWNGVASIGYGATVAAGYFVGGTLKGFYDNLYTSSGYGGALDLGFLGRPLPFIGVAATCHNLGFASGYGMESENLPADLGIGASINLDRLDPGLPGVSATLDARFQPGSTPSVRTGIEYAPAGLPALRLGYRTGPADIGVLGWPGGLTAGVGFKFAGFALGYALAPYGKLGLAHRIGLETRVGRGQPGSLRLRVVDAATMRPLPASVSLGGVTRQRFNLGRTGETLLGGLKTGTLVITTATAGYAPRADTMRITGEREQTATIALHRLRHGSIAGTVYDAATRVPIAGTISYRGAAFGSLNVNPELGTFTVRDLPDGDYEVTAAGPTEDYHSQTCTLRVEPERVTRHDFYLLKRKATIVLEGINFATGKADIEARFEPVLARAAEILKANPSVSVELAGHTDPREISTAQFPSNWELSRARAEAVRRWLVENAGIPPERLDARGYADTQPIAPNDTEEGMAENRRTEFRVVKE